MTFAKAVKSQSKLRAALYGPPGSGKTYSALAIASGIGGKIAVIDSERGASAKYADRFEFDIATLQKKGIDEYTRVIIEAANAGYNVLIIDSMTHAWKELLEEVDRISQAQKGNTFTAWSKATPKQNKFIDTILSYPGHVIVTMRSKMEYQIESVQGKNVPKKIGLAPDQGKDIEFEFDMLIEMNMEHVGVVSKDRTGKFQDQAIHNPGIEFGQQLIGWLMDASLPTPPMDPKPPLPLDALRASIAKAETVDMVNQLSGWWVGRYDKKAIDKTVYESGLVLLQLREEELLPAAFGDAEHAAEERTGR